MQDAITKGEGNSRYLKAPSDLLTQCPNFEALIDALVAGRFLVDLNGINPEGWAQLGTPLDKANILTDATAALVGLGPEATPNEMFAALANLLSSVRGDVNSAKSTASSALEKANSLITYGTSDKTAGSSPLETGTIYIMYE